jgi:hypothetical protein
LLSTPLTRNKTQKTLTVFVVTASIAFAGWLLPAIGVSFDAYVAPIKRSQVTFEPAPNVAKASVGRVGRAGRTKIRRIEHFEAPSVSSVSAQIPDVFAASQSGNEPVLKQETQSGSMELSKAFTISVGAPSFSPRYLGSVWDESQASGPKHRYRGWKKAAVGIAVIGAAIALTATSDDPERRGQ